MVLAAVRVVMRFLPQFLQSSTPIGTLRVADLFEKISFALSDIYDPPSTKTVWPHSLSGNNRATRATPKYGEGLIMKTIFACHQLTVHLLLLSGMGKPEGSGNNDDECLTHQQSAHRGGNTRKTGLAANV
jgi:hypothetical protein